MKRNPPVPEQLRKRIVSELARGLMSLRSAMSCYFPGEVNGLRAVEAPQMWDLVERLTDETLRGMGYHVGDAADPRYSRTRRAIAKVMPKGPRGEVSPVRQQRRALTHQRRATEQARGD